MRENTVRGPAVDLGEFERRLRAPQRKETGSDPLGELARLIQGDEAPSDPYSRILAEPRHANVPAQNAPAQEEAPALRGSFEEADAARYEDYHYVEPTIGHDDDFSAQRYPAQAPVDAPQEDLHGAEGGWSDDAQYLDYGQTQPEPADEAGPRSWFRPWHAVAAISLLAVASIGWGFAHRGDGGNANDAGSGNEIATITAPEGPVKVRPTAEAESAAPDTGGAAVLDRKDNEQVKQVVSNQEQVIEPTLAPGASAPGLPTAPSSAIPAPKKVKSVTVRPDGTRVDDAAALPPAVSRATRAPEAEAPEKPPTAQAPSAAAPKPVAKPKAPPPPRVAAAPAAEDTAPPDAAPATTVGKSGYAVGGYAVQFGAAPTEAEASALVKSVAAKYGASLGGRRPGYARATVGDKTVYRVRVGGVSKESAVAICGKVKAGGGNCFVAGN